MLTPLYFDAELTCGPSCLYFVNKIASPSCKVTSVTGQYEEIFLFINKVAKIKQYFDSYICTWIPYDIRVKSQDFVTQCMIEGVVCNGETVTPLVSLKDFKKNVTVSYSLTKSDNTGVYNRTVTLPKDTLNAFIASLVVSSKTSEDFCVFINRADLKNVK